MFIYTPSNVSGVRYIIMNYVDSMSFFVPVDRGEDQAFL